MSGLKRTAEALVTAAGLAAGSALPAKADEYTTVHKGFAPASTVLHDAAPQKMGLNPAPIEAAKRQLGAYTQPQANGHPMFPGYAAVMGHDGAIVSETHGGARLLYKDASTMLPAAERLPVNEDTIFDLASVSKLFTSLAAVQLIEEGKLSLDEPVATYLPEFGVNGKQVITVRMLLTHTSGLVAWLPLWSKYPDRASRIQAVIDVAPHNTPGEVYEYSDLNLITLGVIVERLRGEALDKVVAKHITGPLGMVDTGYNPTDRRRTAATEYQATPPRGVVWGEVHDENAWSLDGVAGHAGVFSTTKDLSILSQTLLNGGSYKGRRILVPESVELLITDFNEKFPGDAHGLGFELDQRWYMAGLSSPRTAGHTGYAGTSLVIDFNSRSFAILLTNRVHPSRDWGSVNPARRVWAQGLALAMPVEPTKGRTAWRTGLKDATTSTLDLQVPASKKDSKLSFDLFIDTEESDPLLLQVSSDGGRTWQPLAFTLKDRGKQAVADGSLAVSSLRRWVKAETTLPAGEQLVRWANTTDANYVGRGIYVDNVQVRGGVKLDTEKKPSLLTAVNWEQAEN